MWLRKSYVMKKETYGVMQLNFAVTFCIFDQKVRLNV